jgi:hypothetical protein
VRRASRAAAAFEPRDVLPKVAGPAVRIAQLLRHMTRLPLSMRGARPWL